MVGEELLLLPARAASGSARLSRLPEGEMHSWGESSRDPKSGAWSDGNGSGDSHPSLLSRNRELLSTDSFDELEFECSFRRPCGEPPFANTLASGM